MHVNATQGQPILHASGEWSVAKALLTIEVIALRGGGGASKGGREGGREGGTLMVNTTHFTAICIVH